MSAPREETQRRAAWVLARALEGGDTVANVIWLATQLEVVENGWRKPEYEGEVCGWCGHGFISPAHGKCTHCNHNHIGNLPTHAPYDALREAIR